jgi:hypothetical protein
VGSNNTDRGADLDADLLDCAGSLGVETNSVGTRSVHSQEDCYCPLIASTSISEQQPIGPTHQSAEHQEPQHRRLATATSTGGAGGTENGRQSPGGTIYIGRGRRRYQGRYMRLPLKRFRRNGVHLDGDCSSSTAADRDPPVPRILPAPETCAADYCAIYDDGADDAGAATPQHHLLSRNGEQ